MDKKGSGVTVYEILVKTERCINIWLFLMPLICTKILRLLVKAPPIVRHILTIGGAFFMGD